MYHVTVCRSMLWILKENREICVFSVEQCGFNKFKILSFKIQDVWEYFIQQALVSDEQNKLSLMAPENLLTNFFGLVIVQMDPAPVQSKDFDPGSGPGHWFRFCLWLRCGACSWWRKHVCRPFCLECEIKPEMLKYAAWLWLSSRPHPSIPPRCRPVPPSGSFALSCWMAVDVGWCRQEDRGPH